MPQDEGDYDFTAAELIGAEGRYVSLSVEVIDDRARRFFQQVWSKMANVVEKYHEHSGDGQCPAWTAWQVSKWSKEQAQGREGYVAWNGDVMAGFINLRFPFESIVEPGKPIAYLEHIAAFPGCQNTQIWNRRMGGVGQALMAFAIHMSVQRGHDGILGLHAANESVRKWYEELNEAFGGKLLTGPLENTAGFYERSRGLPYYETGSEGAMLLLEEYHHG